MPAGGAAAGRKAGGASAAQTKEPSQYAGPAQISKPEVRRSGFGQTKGQVMKRSWIVTRESRTHGYQIAALKIVEYPGSAVNKIVIFDLAGNGVGSAKTVKEAKAKALEMAMKL